jgi:hypothetical protein
MDAHITNEKSKVFPVKIHIETKIFIFRAGAGVAVIDPYLYVIGGFDDDSPLRFVLVKIKDI